jgi:DNA-binding transcriptional ArsR family regulator
MHREENMSYTTEEEFAAGGFSIIDRTDGGLVAHRGVLQEGEYVDYFELRAQVEAELGFTYAAIAAAYKGGRPTAEQRQQREKIDARLLALSREGGNMDKLAEAIGLGPATIDRALARAKDVEVVPQMKNAVVRSTLVCFICGEPGATARKRRQSESPANEVGTINLCDRHFNPGVSKIGGRRSSKRKVDVVGLIQDRDMRTFGGRRIGVDWS